MKILRIVLAIVLVVIGVVSTVGSGGGGSGGWNISYPSPDFPPNITPIDIASMDITAANAQDVAATAVQAHDHALQVAAIIGGQVFPRLPGAPDLLSSNSRFELFSAAVTTGEPVTGACAISGMVTVSGYPTNDPVSLSALDKFDIVFDACDDGDGYTIDGSISLEVLSLEGDPRTDVFLLKYGLQSMALTIASGADNYAASVVGSSFLLELDSRAFPVIVLRHGLGPLRLDTQTDIYSWYTYTVGNVRTGEHQSLTLNAELSPVTKRVQTDGSLMRSDFLGGIFHYDTIVPLQATDAQDLESGEILIDGGTGKGTLRIVIESVTSVRLEIDTDGDGTVDDYQYTTWATLRG
jgi:hypothetical protein